MRKQFLEFFNKEHGVEVEQDTPLSSLPFPWDSLAVLVTVGIYASLGVKIEERKVIQAKCMKELLEMCGE